MEYSNVTDMSFMFNECNSFHSLPDVSNWDISNVKSVTKIFGGCNELLNIPNKFKHI